MTVKCPCCGSTALYEWRSVATQAFRIVCKYCETDSGEFPTIEEAWAEMEKKKPIERATDYRLPYVLSVEELLSPSAYSQDFIRPVWYENRGIFCCPALLSCSEVERDRDEVGVEWHGGYGTTTQCMKEYGKWWRVWSSKPSAMQMEEEPWE